MRKNDHTGETAIATNGMKMTIIAYRNYTDMDIQFEDGEIRKNVGYECFQKGNVQNPHFPIFGKGVYRTFQTQYAYTAPDGNVYFYCTCQKCGFKKNLTARELINLNHKIHKTNRIGETALASNGQVMTIITYRNATDIDVRFEDGYVACHKTYASFKKGKIGNPNKSYTADSHIGETAIATNGQEMTIIAYRNTNDIDVQFEDGYVTYHTRYYPFKKGMIKNPNKSCTANRRIGETAIATNGQEMTIIAYQKSNDIDVQFEDGYVTYHTRYYPFKKGGIKNPHFPMWGKGTYKTFQTQYAYTAPNGNVYFYCKCQKCGLKRNLTARELINLNHTCENIEGSEN